MKWWVSHYNPTIPFLSVTLCVNVTLRQVRQYLNTGLTVPLSRTNIILTLLIGFSLMKRNFISLWEGGRLISPPLNHHPDIPFIEEKNEDSLKWTDTVPSSFLWTGLKTTVSDRGKYRWKESVYVFYLEEVPVYVSRT